MIKLCYTIKLNFQYIFDCRDNCFFNTTIEQILPEHAEKIFIL